MNLSSDRYLTIPVENSLEFLLLIMHYRLVLVSTPKSKSSKRNDASILVEKYIQLASIFIQLSNRNRLRQNRWTIFAWCFLSLLIPPFSREFKNTQKTKYINENGTPSIFKEEKIRTLNEDIVIQWNGKKKYIYIYIKHVFFSTVLITFVIQKFIFLKKEGKKEKERLDFLTNTPFERITRKLRV